MSDSSEASGSAPSYPTSFGRGWIPADRDIGLPDDVLPGTGRGTAGTAVEGTPGPRHGCAQEASREDASPLHHASHGPPPRDGEDKPNHNTWTPARKAAFLHHLAETGNVRASAARVGLSHQSAYLAKRRDRAFRAGWEAALVLAREAAAQVLATRAIDGIEEPVWFRGENVGTRVRHDSRLLLAHLARLDKAAEETDAGELALRFDELVAVVAGEAPGEDFADQAEYWWDPTPLLPVAREPWADRAAARSRDAAHARWRADLKAKTATRADEPSDLHTPWFEAALAEWDAWHARACACVDAAVAEQSKGPPTRVFPRVEIDMAAFYAGDEDLADDDDAPDDPRPHWRDLGYGADDVVMEYKSMEMAGLLPPVAPSAPAPGAVAGGAGRAQDTGNCGNFAGRFRLVAAGKRFAARSAALRNGAGDVTFGFAKAGAELPPPPPSFASVCLMMRARKGP